MITTQSAKLARPALAIARRTASSQAEAAEALIKKVSQMSEADLVKLITRAEQSGQAAGENMRLPAVETPTVAASDTAVSTHLPVPTSNNRALLIVKDSAVGKTVENGVSAPRVNGVKGAPSVEFTEGALIEGERAEVELTGASGALKDVIQSQGFERFAQKLQDIVPVQSHRFQGLIDWAIGSKGSKG